MAERRARGRPRAFNDKTEQNTIQSLDRAMMILERISSSNGETLTNLANALDQSPATVYRVLSTLAAREIVELSPVSQTWHVGTGAFRIGSAYLRRTNLLERAQPVMRQLMEATGETANLGVRRDAHVLFVSQVETHASIRAFFPPGTMSPMHASGVGKALLSEMEDAALEAVLAKTTLTRFTDKTLTDPVDLLEDLRRARARGYAIDDEERNEGMRCVATPIFNAAGEAVAGLSVSGPISRMRPEDLETLGHRVREAARTVSLSLGWFDANADTA
jgi:IclR family acetate operon transcriptional repressor